jgi:hypothetical protein
MNIVPERNFHEGNGNKNLEFLDITYCVYNQVHVTRSKICQFDESNGAK